MVTYLFPIKISSFCLKKIPPKQESANYGLSAVFVSSGRKKNVFTYLND